MTATADGAASVAEPLCARILRGAGIAGWRANHPVLLDGLWRRIDIVFTVERIAVEVDGWAFHHRPERFVDDRRRQNSLVGAGWLVLRFTWADLTERPD